MDRRTRILASLAALMVGTVLVAAVMLSIRYEQSERQEAVLRATEDAVAAIRARMADTERRLGLLATELQRSDAAPHFERMAHELLAEESALLRVEWRDDAGALLHGAGAPSPRPRLDRSLRDKLAFEAMLALRSAIEFDRPLYSRPYYVSFGDSGGFEVTELAIPVDGAPNEALVAVYSMPLLIDGALPASLLRSHQVYLTETDGTFVARSSVRLHGAGIYTASVPLELPGMSLQLRTNSAQGSPKLIPNLLTALLIAVTLGLLASGALLWRDSRLRARAERELRDQHAFRKAMEDSLFTGLRARDLEGRITYVNPAFCRMTGCTADELVGRDPPMPYWVPDLVQDGRPRLDRVRGSDAMRLGYETEFVRRDGERFPVLIFEAPLIDERGRQTGWMGSILDVSEQRRVETLARVQQEKLQVNARMALLGEVASALSHELNQPLAAIASYATAGENLLATAAAGDRGRGEDPARPVGHGGPGASEGALRTALSRIRDQSERAGQVIRSVQAFMRRRHVDRAPIRFDALLASIEPLIQLQARRSGCTLSWRAEPDTVVLGDRTMLEQVMLNLTRNAIEAMEQSAAERRVLEVEARREPPGGGTVAIEVRDRGSGVAPEIEPQLFNAFVTTKPEGLGIGLSLCRSVIEAHGGRLRHLPRDGGGAVFRFELPAVAASDFPAETLA